MAARRRGRPGFIQWLGRALARGGRWCLFHPQPFLVLGLVTIGSAALWGGMTHSDAFRVTDIRMPANSPLKAPGSLVGQNLWTVDLVSVASVLKAQQPQLKRVRVVRIVPNTLQVDTLERAPVAQVRLGQWYAVDTDGFVLPGASAAPWDHLVILKGLEESRPPLKVGRENTAGRLMLALRLVDLLRHSPALVGHQVKAVDVNNPAQVSFLIDEGIEVRCGNEETLGTQLDRLRAVLRRVWANQLAIRYIDVRFKDPVIGPAA